MASKQADRLVVVSFSKEYDNELDYIKGLVKDGGNASKFICEALRKVINGVVDIPKKEVNQVDLTPVFEKIAELERLIKRPETKVFSIRPEEIKEDTEDKNVDPALISAVNTLEW
jgi:hypothetical protein